MNRALAGLVLASIGGAVTAQDLEIVNARILDGTGRVIERGAIVVADGRIVSVTAGNLAPGGAERIDVGGMTVLPGYIDAHRHIMSGDDEIWLREESVVRMREFLESGFTTLMSGGGPVPGIVELQRRIESGELEGPRIVTSGRVNTNGNTVDKARAEIREMAATGVEIIKTSINLEPGTDRPAVLAALTEEAHRQGLEVMVHAVTVPDMLAAVDAGVDKLVHTPHDSFMTPAQAKRVADAGIENLSTIGFAVPFFGVFNDDNIPTFRDGSPWPDGILGTGSNAAGEKAVNGRTLWDAGVVYGFGTDTGFHPRDGLAHELRALNLMFSPRDMLELMGPNTAAFIDKTDELGTLEPGKLADIVVVDGDPLELIFNLLNVEIVIKGGEIVVDKR